MNIVADENIDVHIIKRLRADGHSVQSLAEFEPGIDDEAVLRESRETNAILLTADKDFGELVFRQGLVHSGVVLIRLAAWRQKQRLTSSLKFLLTTPRNCIAPSRCCPPVR